MDNGDQTAKTAAKRKNNGRSEKKNEVYQRNGKRSMLIEQEMEMQIRIQKAE